MTIGGLISRIKEVKTVDLQVSWKWYNQDKGLVEWTFTNIGNAIGSGLLFRATYPFGNAFWPIYEDNTAFDTQFTTMAIPLVDQGSENNSPPLAIFKNPDGSMFVAFVFTLEAGQTWSMLEGGFSSDLTPDYDGSPYIVPAVRDSISTYRIEWDAEQCQGYNQQAGTNLPCPANPLNITSAVFSISTHVKPMFNDFILSSTGQDESYLQMIIDGIEYDNMAEIIAGLEDVFGKLSSEVKDRLYLKEEKQGKIKN